MSCLLGLAVLLSPVASGAVVLTLLESTANVSGTIASPIGNWSDSAQSLDLDPLVQVSQSFGSGINANSSVNAGHNLGLATLAMATGFTAGSGGQTTDSTIDYDFALRFTLDVPSVYTFQNNNNTGSFPRASAPTAGTSASLVYELREEGGGSVFIYAAPSVGVAEIYASGTIPAGTYLWTGVGSAAALGNPCCGFQTADITGNVRLSFEDAPAVPTPGLQATGALLLTCALLGVALVRTRLKSVSAR